MIGTGITMSPIFGVIFGLAGLALAVLAGLVLYPDKTPEEAPSGESFKVQEKNESV
jgi:hypothetical protein